MSSKFSPEPSEFPHLAEIEGSMKFPWTEEPRRANLRLVLVLSDGIRGHVNQSRGIAYWLSQRTGAEILELEIPALEGVRRAKARAGARSLLEGNRRKARDWLVSADGDEVIRQVGHWFGERNIREGDADSVIIISAGTMPAFYNAALGYIWRCTSATVMTPSVIGTEPFDFAIVPEHDHPRDASNVMTTLGAPNLIVREELDRVGSLLMEEFPPRAARSWGILIGGDDANYRIGAKWVQKVIGRIFQVAERENADIYITTSRRTSKEAENALRRITSGRDDVRFLLLASTDTFNPVPGMLGACDEIFCTEDSVNMVSEAATAGHRVVLLPVGRAGKMRDRAQRATARLIELGLAPRSWIWGTPKFDRTFDRFESVGSLVKFGDWLRERMRAAESEFAPLEDEVETDPEGFNEARRAADWILRNMNDLPEEDTE